MNAEMIKAGLVLAVFGGASLLLLNAGGQSLNQLNQPAKSAARMESQSGRYASFEFQRSPKPREVARLATPVRGYLTELRDSQGVLLFKSETPLRPSAILKAAAENQINLRDAQLSGMAIEPADAGIHRSFSGGELADPMPLIVGARLKQANFSKSRLRCKFVDCDLEDSNFDGVYMCDVTFKNCRLQRAKFSSVYMVESGGLKLENCDASDANFSHAVLSGPVFVQSNLSGANLANSYCNFNAFVNIDFSRANFTEACFRWCNFVSCSIDQAIFDKSALAYIHSEARWSDSQSRENPSELVPVIPPADAYGGRSATGWWTISIPAHLHVTREDDMTVIASWDEDARPEEDAGKKPPAWYNWEHRWALEFNKHFEPPVNGQVSAEITVNAEGIPIGLSFREFRNIHKANGKLPAETIQIKGRFQKAVWSAVDKTKVPLPEQAKEVTFEIQIVGGRHD